MGILVWLIDDSSSHHTAALETLKSLPAFDFEGFLDSHQAIAEFASRAEGAPTTLPRIVLMDFFLAGDRGDRVTSALRELQPPGFSPIIVGYSSVAYGSQAIVEAGGDIVVRKRISHSGCNPDLRVYLESFMRIA